ncbi:alpha/beta fold hydrolase [Azospirillum argentinense]|uniref:alpha/beta fold hydrolase n=1 Tax=Azospirillum argentinense TaxID=2970906 RepID=UPI0032DE606A
MPSLRIGLAAALLAALVGALVGAASLWAVRGDRPPAVPGPAATVIPVAVAPARPASAPTTPAGPTYGALRTAPCPSPDRTAPALPSPRCAILTVPQNWDHTAGPVVARPAVAGPAVEVFVTVLPATGPGPQAEPVLVLTGGPGQAGSDEIGSAGTALKAMRARRDIILLDQRGTGRSVPSLRCPAMDPMRFWYGGLSPDDVLGCLGPVQAAGYRLEHFDTRQSALDVAALRRALDIRSWNVVATSYGTILAQELVRWDGDAIRTLVLNSPTTASSTWLDADRLASVQRAFRIVVEDCASETACARHFPSLAGAVPRIAKALSAKPLALRVRDPRNGRETELRLGWPVIAGTLAFHLGSGAEMVRVPAMLDYLDKVSAGRREADARLLTDILAPEPFWQIFDHLAYGLNLVVGCRENRPRIDARAARAAGAVYYPQVVADSIETDYDVACPVLQLPPADPAFYRPVATNTPTLILTGVYDTLSPTARSDTLAATLGDAKVVRFRGLGHDVLSTSSCAAALAARFVESAGADAPQDCAERFLPPPFHTTLVGGGAPTQ